MGTVLGWCSVPPWVASALAYPVGNVNSFSDQTEKLAREAGYRVSFLISRWDEYGRYDAKLRYQTSRRRRSKLVWLQGPGSDL